MFRKVFGERNIGANLICIENTSEVAILAQEVAPLPHVNLSLSAQFSYGWVLGKGGSTFVVTFLN